MPRIKDVQPHLSEIVSSLKNIEGVRDIFVWGSYADNIHNENFRLRNIDILARTRFFSDDLLSVDKNIIKEAIKIEELEDSGYDPQCVEFSQKFTQLSQYNINHWTISSDKKLLHWGPISESFKEGFSINNDAHKYALKETGISRNQLNLTSEKNRNNWYNCFSKYIKNYTENMPSWWYKIEDVVIKDVLKKAIKI